MFLAVEPIARDEESLTDHSEQSLNRLKPLDMPTNFRDRAPTSGNTDQHYPQITSTCSFIPIDRRLGPNYLRAVTIFNLSIVLLRSIAFDDR